MLHALSYCKAMWFVKVLIFLFFGYAASSDSKKYNIRLTKYANGCPGINVIANFTEVVINKNTLDFKAYFSEDAPADLKAEFSIERCLDRDSPNTCEKYHTLRVPFYCQLVNMGTWTTFETIPEWRCPYKKGLYVTKKTIVFDIGDVSIISITGNYYWKVVSKISSQSSKKMIMCLNVEGMTYLK